MTAATFTQQLIDKKSLIDAELKLYVASLSKETLSMFTPDSSVAMSAYEQVLARGGKRIRGALTMVAYEMCGGTDTDMILQAACAIEMTHAYILTLDDIMDKSATRRGGPSAHMIIADYHKKHQLSGDSYHFGEAIAINAATIGFHDAQLKVTNLNVANKSKLQALSLLNSALIVTGHGQINDIFNEVRDDVTEQSVDQVLEWKTAHYTFLNPLQFGMALAGADEKTIHALHDYCMHAGRAFQITDDILGTFASEQEAGKSPMDDVREGKRTVLSVHALQSAPNGDKNFLITMLGNEKLTQSEFNRCKEIFIETGALKVSQDQAKYHVDMAKISLQHYATLFSKGGVDFLTQLVDSLLGRTA